MKRPGYLPVGGISEKMKPNEVMKLQAVSAVFNRHIKHTCLIEASGSKTTIIRCQATKHVNKPQQLFRALLPVSPIHLLKIYIYIHPPKKESHMELENEVIF